ncbi:MAG TPA: FAD-binding oxidoreductase [Hyphomicrobiaceae bacterium]|nr:FAD-binding oxidoreductase [Hyphomicrobiaceae bacterium]
MAAAEMKRAIVIGAGIVGACTGLELERRGYEVTLVDRLPPGEGCSFGNAGILSSQAVVPMATPGIHKKALGMLTDPDGPLTVRLSSLRLTVPWLWRMLKASRAERMAPIADAMKALYATTVELHEALAREAGVPELVVPGRYLYVYRDPANADVEKGLGWRLRRERGAELEVFDGAALQEIEPELSPIYKRGVRVGPLAKTTNPHRLTAAYARLLERKGGRILKAEVREIVPAATATAPIAVETSAGRLEAELLVVAAGAWSLDLLRPLGVKFSLIAERGYHLTYPEPGFALSHMVSEGERYFALTTMEMGLRFAGTDELSHADDAPRWRRADVLARFAPEMFPRLGTANPSRWSGPRPGTPDSLPVIDRVPGQPRILIACGHGHLGLTGGPMTGRIVGALASGERLNLDLAPYAVTRFQ